jgi:hypothetical protein
MDLHNVAVLQDFRFVDLLPGEAAVAPKPRELHPVWQIAMDQPGEMGNC